MSIKWYHFSFKKKNKKQTQATKKVPSNAIYGGAWVVSSLPPPVPLGKCESCGGDIFNQIRECELCGKKICEDCTLVITKIMHNLTITGTTIWSVGSAQSRILPPNPKHQHQDIIICTGCSDLLKLSLRIAAAQGVIEKDESGEE